MARRPRILDLSARPPWINAVLWVRNNVLVILCGLHSAGFLFTLLATLSSPFIHGVTLFQVDTGGTVISYGLWGVCSSHSGRCLDPTLAYIAYTNLISLIYPRSGSGQLSMRVLLGLMTFHPLASLCAMVAALVEAVFFVRLYVRRRKQRVDQHDLEDNAGIRQTGSTSTSDVIELISPRAIDHFLPSESASEHHSEPHRSSTSHTPSAAKPSLSLPILVLSSLAFLLTLLMFCVDVSFVSLARLRLRSVSPSTSSLPAGSHYKVSWGATSWLMFLATLCCGAAWTVVWMHWVRCHKKMG